MCPMSLFDRFFTPVEVIRSPNERRCVYLERNLSVTEIGVVGSFLPITRATRFDSTIRELATLVLGCALLQLQFFTGLAGWPDQKLEQLPIRRFGHHRVGSGRESTALPPPLIQEGSNHHRHHPTGYPPCDHVSSHGFRPNAPLTASRVHGYEALPYTRSMSYCPIRRSPLEVENSTSLCRCES